MPDERRILVLTVTDTGFGAGITVEHDEGWWAQVVREHPNRIPQLIEQMTLTFRDFIETLGP